jgi:UDP-N-acetylmuramoylalanine--D-glutamate ligase
VLLSELASRDIGILGAGREGLAAWRWVREHFPEKQLTIYDERPESGFPDEMFDGPQDRLVCGPFDADLLSRHDVLIRSPGISPYRSDLSSLRENEVRFTSASSLWFSSHPGAKTICITGTKGKSTTAALVAHLLESAGHVAHLAGNIGQPLLDLAGDDADWWVIELSSYQLVDLEARPTVAAIINLTDEHLDWHGGDHAYQNDKLRIAELAEDRPLIANAEDELLKSRLGARPNICWFGTKGGFHVRDNQLFNDESRFEDIPRTFLPGSHNLLNLAAALTILESVGVKIEDLATALSSFAGLPHRLQNLGARNGVSYVSDSLSTTPVATIAALEALGGGQTVLLAGGMDRGVDWRPLMQAMKVVEPYAVICLPDNGRDIASVMKDSGLNPKGGIQCAAGLAEAMQMAAQISRPGDTVLLSPGAPSFPHFRDYEDRGEQFQKLAGI